MNIYFKVAVYFTTLILSSQVYAGVNQTIKFGTMNMEWYGIGGAMSGEPSDEYRDPFFKEFFAKYLADVDVLMLEEVVDVGRLSQVLPDRTCTSYESNDYKHQHVAVCLKPGFRFDKEADDDNYAFEDIARMGNSRLRPALHGVLKRADGSPVAHLIGLHLKAMSTEGEMRAQQVDLLALRIRDLKDQLPVVMMGDMNTFPGNKAGTKVADVDTFKKIFKDRKVNMTFLETAAPNTYKSFPLASKFDHIVVSDGVKQVGDVSVFIACNQPERNAPRFESTEFYNRVISDHCPVTVSLEFKK